MMIRSVLWVGSSLVALVTVAQPVRAQSTDNMAKLEQQITQLQGLFEQSQRELRELRAQVKANTEATKRAQASADTSASRAKATAAKADAVAAKADGTAAKADATAAKAEATEAKLGSPSTVVTATNVPPNATVLNNKSLTPPNVILEPLQPTMKLINDPNTWLGLYGSIEATLQATTNADAKGAVRVGQIGSSWMTPSRFGLTGAHLLDQESGLNAIFRVEAEYQTPTGNQDTPGVLFNRDAWIGLESQKLGKLTVGRQNSLGRDAIQFWGSPYGTTFANLGEGGWINQERTQAIKEYVGSPTGSRVDSGIVYKKLTGNWYTAVSYQFGSQQGINNDSNLGPGGVSQAGKFNQGSSQAVALAYNFGDLSVGGLYNHANVAGYDDQIFGIGANYTFSPHFRVQGGYLIYTADQSFGGRRVDNIVTLSSLYTLDSHIDFALAYNGIFSKNALRDSSGNTLSPYTDASFVATADSNGVQTVGSGNRHTIYGSARYKFDAQTLAFVGFTYTRTMGGFVYDQLNGFRDSWDLGTGVVYNF